MAALAAIALAGCAVGPDYTAPDPGHVPESLPTIVPPSSAAGGNAASGDSASWYDGFNDSTLSSLLDIASTNSLDILQTLKRIEASRASLAGARAEFWPNVGFSASTSKGKSYNPDSDTERSSARFDASWEIDIFGKVSRSVEAARAELEAAEFGLDDAMVSLRAEIAAEYVNLRLRQNLLAIIRDNLGIQREFEEIAKSKFDAGFAPELDWLSAESQLRATEASLPAAEAETRECIRRIELLCSLAPGELDAMLAPEAPLPLPPATPAAIPSDLLRQRPDVRRAERNYAAALARIGVAKANYFPSVSIGAGFALATDSFASWGDAVRSMDFGPSLSWSILSFGRNRAKVANAKATAEEAALAYRSAVLSAFHEVENGAISLDSDLKRENPLAAAVEAQRKADALALAMYREDLGEYRDVLTARQSLLSQERSLAELRANLALSEIALCKALGTK